MLKCSSSYKENSLNVSPCKSLSALLSFLAKFLERVEHIPSSLKKKIFLKDACSNVDVSLHLAAREAENYRLGLGGGIPC